MTDGFSKKAERRDNVRPPTMRTPAALPRGPRLYRTPKDLGYKGPVSEPPPGFVTGTTSKTEWSVYHALAKITGLPTDPRQPPFMGAYGVWEFQQAFAGGRSTPGGAVIDFIVRAGRWSDQDVALRIQTERFHLYTTAEKQFSDQAQLERISASMRVIDIFDQDFVWDPTGQAIIVLLKDSLSGSTFPNPNTAGVTERGTRIRSISV